MAQEFWLPLYLALPCFGANMVPVLFHKLRLLPSLNISIDGGKTFRGKRIFGDHKTVRGFLVGTFFAIFITLVQWRLEQNGTITIPYFSGIWAFGLYGFLAGIGALAGDALESFFKRQINIPSGKPFFPFDQIDYIIGFLICTSFLIPWDTSSVILLLLAGLILNPITNLFAYVLKIKNTYW